MSVCLSACLSLFWWSGNDLAPWVALPKPPLPDTLSVTRLTEDGRALCVAMTMLHRSKRERERERERQGKCVQPSVLEPECLRTI